MTEQQRITVLGRQLAGDRADSEVAAAAAEELVAIAVDPSTGWLLPSAAIVTSEVVGVLTAHVRSPSGWEVLARVARSADALGADPRRLQAVRSLLEREALPLAGFVLDFDQVDSAVLSAMEMLRWCLGFVDDPAPIAKLLREFRRRGGLQSRVAVLVKEGPHRDAAEPISIAAVLGLN